MHKDTIIAPATPPGEGGVAIVRLSGPLAEPCLNQVFVPASGNTPLSSHRLVLGTVVSPEGRVIDEVMAVVMRAPRSYTAEDVVEIHCHGNPLVVRQIVDTCLQHQVRLAQPGEFTLRAFLNGRLDLSQAEGVIDLIQANSERAGRVAAAQLEGELSRRIHSLREPLLKLRSLVEAYIDFPEEDIPEDPALVLAPAQEVLDSIGCLCASFDQGRIIRDGLGVLILGRPNVGKSSLLNALVGESRAIVTDIPGTTRDVLEETITLGGLTVRLMDTAGIRSSVDPIEQEGVRRAQGKLDQADLILLLIDGSRSLVKEDHDLLELCREKPLLIVRNKSDLGLLPLSGPWSAFESVDISAHSGAGMDSLRGKIVGRGGGEGSGSTESFFLCDRRHLEALTMCADALQRFCSEWGHLSLDLLALDLREALDHLGVITGETTPEEVLNTIFSRFCIGK
ncbi:MAG: tRNA uridine-5-carboxymethylaminomethyl(34) synthesis GTPase MnmE [Desulfuromonas sp.]|nr:MAG: tRNA uridine-5-carboxymethylaminomethyl(34) synthesis GTPase MnmE [Desulfuromonas sp.]